jgi:hypothetical protein
MLVYFLESTCTTCWADRATKKYKNSDRFFEKNVQFKNVEIFTKAFAILSFCY